MRVLRFGQSQLLHDQNLHGGGTTQILPAKNVGKIKAVIHRSSKVVGPQAITTFDYKVPDIEGGRKSLGDPLVDLGLSGIYFQRPAAVVQYSQAAAARPDRCLGKLTVA